MYGCSNAPVKNSILTVPVIDAYAGGGVFTTGDPAIDERAIGNIDKRSCSSIEGYVKMINPSLYNYILFYTSPYAVRCVFDIKKNKIYVAARCESVSYNTAEYDKNMYVISPTGTEGHIEIIDNYVVFSRLSSHSNSTLSPSSITFI